MADKTAQQVNADVQKREKERRDKASLNMKIKVYSPFKVYFDGMAESISAVNDTGPFDILPRHHNFMTLLNTGEVVVRTYRSQETFHISKGIMHVKADQVVVFLDV